MSITARFTFHTSNKPATVLKTIPASTPTAIKKFRRGCQTTDADGHTIGTSSFYINARQNFNHGARESRQMLNWVIASVIQQINVSPGLNAMIASRQSIWNENREIATPAAQKPLQSIAGGRQTRHYIGYNFLPLISRYL